MREGKKKKSDGARGRGCACACILRRGARTHWGGRLGVGSGLGLLVVWWSCPAAAKIR